MDSHWDLYNTDDKYVNVQEDFSSNYPVNLIPSPNYFFLPYLDEEQLAQDKLYPKVKLTVDLSGEMK